MNTADTLRLHRTDIQDLQQTLAHQYEQIADGLEAITSAMNILDYRITRLEATQPPPYTIH